MVRRYRIQWAPAALCDLDEIIDYVALRRGADIAAKLYVNLKSRVGTLATQPARGRVVPELRAVGVTEYRELIVAPYRICFRITGREVGIVSVLDGRRDVEETLIHRALR